MKILVATEKPFASKAVEGIKAEIEGAGNQLILLEKYTEKAQLLDAVGNIDALIVRSDKVTPEVLDAAKELKIVVRAGAGYDNIDTAYAKEKGVVVENTPGQNSNAVAELVNATGEYSDLLVRRALTACRMLSCDVSAGYDPNFAGVFERKNAALLFSNASAYIGS